MNIVTAGKKGIKAGKIIKQALQMQGKLRAIKRTLAEEAFEFTDPESGITVRLRGGHQIDGLEVPGMAGFEVLEAALVKALNHAHTQVDAESTARIKAVTAGTAIEGFEGAV